MTITQEKRQDCIWKLIIQALMNQIIHSIRFLALRLFLKKTILTITLPITNSLIYPILVNP